jgi:integrase
VAAAAGQAGLGTIYAHRLRHSAAACLALSHVCCSRDPPG